jgi:hypothetical protein
VDRDGYKKSALIEKRLGLRLCHPHNIQHRDALRRAADWWAWDASGRRSRVETLRLRGGRLLVNDRSVVASDEEEREPDANPDRPPSQSSLPSPQK